MNIIGINGYIGSGKDTVGKIIQYLQVSKDYPSLLQGMDFEEFSKEATGTKAIFYSANEGSIGSEWEIKKYAGKLKQIASILTGIPVEKFEDQEFKKSYLGPEWGGYYGSKFITGKIPERENDYSPKYRPLTVREFLQKLGTEAMRDVIHPNTWVNALFADYHEKYDVASQHYYSDGTRSTAVYPEDCKWIITDTRFVNEAQAIKDRGGIVIRVNRDWELRKNGEYIEPDFIPHSSETGLDSWDFDFFIENNSNMDDLVEAVRVMLEYYKII